jgi:hypothetical protein
MVLSAYQERKLDLMFGREVNFPGPASGISAAFEEIEGILKTFSAYFTNLARPHPEIDFRPAAAGLKDCEGLSRILQELVFFFDGLGTHSLDELIDNYNKLPAVGTARGSSYQFLCFIKNGSRRPGESETRAAFE